LYAIKPRQKILEKILNSVKSTLPLNVRRFRRPNHHLPRLTNLKSMATFRSEKPRLSLPLTSVADEQTLSMFLLCYLQLLQNAFLAYYSGYFM